MKKFKTTLAAATMSAALLTSNVTAIPAFAETSANQPALCYELLSVAVPSLGFVGSTAYCETTAHADSSVTKMTMSQTLQKKGLIFWSDVDGAYWEKTVYTSDIDMADSFNVSQSGKYRVEVEITMRDSSGNTETVTVHSVEVNVTL